MQKICSLNSNQNLRENDMKNLHTLFICNSCKNDFENLHGTFGSVIKNIFLNIENCEQFLHYML